MKTRCGFGFKRLFQSEGGSALVISMLLLVVLTIIGVAATNTSVLEILIANSSKKKAEAFYAAEAGIDHARKLLSDMIAAQASLDTWDLSDFADVSSSEAEHPGEKYVFQNKAVGDCAYTVTVFAGKANTEGLIFLKSVGTSPNGGRAVLEVSFLGKRVLPSGTTSFSSYGGQQNAGSAKSNTGYDINAMTADELSTYQLNEDA
ncbi:MULTISPECIES: pilus assembly PilX family protein [Desulfococcus]|uniref:Type 4 fimbrial biogenesis protein PilX, N-terminal domain containing protein n=1 Tax=Desulfococcus multivorans DSM 2059 TaxID=1121405 RepID=S7VA75_DESML|nr:type 4 fimbrial biogenesis protein PilX [Desulfococcus multivorans]AOY58047.1 PilX: predicted pilus assembly protein, type IV [Desulfococcus multivorans]AQV00409.1 hypothetical protein B2D07_06245 [Desulfococcus multivorans]EPR41383.1 Type 4 fimbrial biogenesis protein PilX, N-terminal domain containing protein [Desulfococcus multivorans DSM 2059]SJZ71137.1 PilX N-terminal [Desulfococcus multivorans DSM 2059]